MPKNMHHLQSAISGNQTRIARLVVLFAFFVLAVQLFVILIEFKPTTLAGFVLVPFVLWNKTAFLAERVLGNVISSGIEMLVLAVIATLRLAGDRAADEIQHRCRDAPGRRNRPRKALTRHGRAGAESKGRANADLEVRAFVGKRVVGASQPRFLPLDPPSC